MRTFGVDDLQKLLFFRAIKCLELAGDILKTGEYYIAGSSIASDTIRDIDVYPVELVPFNPPETNIVVETANAVTVRNPTNGTLIQFCRFEHNSLKALLESFDFSHIQAGALIRDGAVNRVEWTDTFLYSRAAHTSYYTGSEFPSSSLVRLLKYYRRGEINERNAIGAAFAIVNAIIKRGFTSYEDFKNQLDAVDLGMIPEDQNEMVDELRELYEILLKNNNSKSPENKKKFEDLLS